MPAPKPPQEPKPWDPYWSFHNLSLQLGVTSCIVAWMSGWHLGLTLFLAGPALFLGLLGRVRSGHKAVRQATLVGMSFALLALVLVGATMWRG